MREVSVFEAKAHLSALIEDVFKHKDPITITRRGARVVVLVPFSSEKKCNVKKICQDFYALQKEVGKANLSEVQQWKKMGRL